MNAFYFICFYLLLAISVMQNLMLFTVVIAIAFTLRFGAIGLIPLAIMLDAYFGAFDAVPVFSLIAVGWYIGFELLKPRLRLL